MSRGRSKSEEDQVGKPPESSTIASLPHPPSPHIQNALARSLFGYGNTVAKCVSRRRVNPGESHGTLTVIDALDLSEHDAATMRGCGR